MTEERKPFGYLDGMEPADDAPVMDNPARIYCPPCRAAGQTHCADPGFCGEMRPMKPLPDAFEAASAPNPPSAPRRDSKELVGRGGWPVLSLDTTKGQKPLDDGRVGYERQGSGYDPGAVGYERQGRDSRPRRIKPGEAIPERLLGRRMTFKPLPDGEEKSYEWFMENIDKTVDDFESEVLK